MELPVGINAVLMLDTYGQASHKASRHKYNKRT
jgi:hypothetical protein